jgi:hypothetical protein
MAIHAAAQDNGLVTGSIAVPAAVPTQTPHAGGVSAPGSGDSGSAAQTGMASVAAASSQDHQTLVSTPNVLEVGLDTGTHGWLRIRAELQPDSGQVTATMLASSSGAAASLHQQAPAISAYLASEHINAQVNVAPVAADRTASSALDAGLASGGGGAQQQGSGQHQQSTGAAKGSDPLGSGQTSDWTMQEAIPSSSLAPIESYSPTAGSWLNVLA